MHSNYVVSEYHLYLVARNVWITYFSLPRRSALC